MDNEMKQIMADLEASHKRAMEGLNALNKELKSTINEAKDYIGYPKNK